MSRQSVARFGFLNSSKNGWLCSTRMSMPGLIRWTADGTPAWYAVQDSRGPANWVDCYALNVGADRVWAYPSTAFPLVETDESGMRCVRRTPVRLARGVLVAGERVAFVAGQRHGTPCVAVGSISPAMVSALNIRPVRSF